MHFQDRPFNVSKACPERYRFQRNQGVAQSVFGIWEQEKRPWIELVTRTGDIFEMPPRENHVKSD